MEVAKIGCLAKRSLQSLRHALQQAHIRRRFAGNPRQKMLETALKQRLIAPVIMIASRSKKFPRCPVWIGQAAEERIHLGGWLLNSKLEIGDR